MFDVVIRFREEEFHPPMNAEQREAMALNLAADGDLGR